MKTTFFRLLPSLAILSLAGSLVAAGAVSSSQTVLKDSVKAVETAPTTGSPDPHRPMITRQTLKPEELSASMDFQVVLKMRNWAELQARAARGERISAQEMADRYDPTPADYQKVLDWLTGQGFTITRQDDRHLAVFVRGTGSQIREGLQVDLARVTLEGKEYTSATSAPTIPAALAPLLVGINGLQPQIQMHKHLVVKPSSLTGTGQPYLPSQIAKAYDVNGLYSANVTGAGQTIVIVIDTFPLSSDLTSFWQTYGVNQSINNITFIQAVAGTLPSTSEEETLDVEWSSSIAPGAKVRVYASTSLSNSNLDQTYQQVYNDVLNHPEYNIRQMSMSYGIGEQYTTSSQVQTDDQYFAELATAGVTVFAASGDGGATPDNNHGTYGPVQAESPASDPNVTGVGGTSLKLNGSGYVGSETAWSYSGGGASIYFSRPSWQAGTGVPSGSTRDVPDVACPADENEGAVLYYKGAQTSVGGTSWGSPTWAGFCALINQYRANAGLGAVGLLASRLYSLIDSPNFRDIASGSNATSFSSGKYYTGTGYDLVTGIGAPQVQILAASLVAPIQPAAQTLSPGQTATVAVTAGGSPVGYQWQRMPLGSTTWSNLNNGGAYSGATTSSLTVSGVTSSMSGDEFQCVVTYSKTTVTTSTSVLLVETPLIIKTLAGKAGTSGYLNGTGTAAEFAYPSGVAVDGNGNIYIADYNNNVIRKVTPAGVVTTPYGSTSGASGTTDGNGNNALFDAPNAVAADSANNLYVADTGNNRIRKITASTGAVSTLSSSGWNTPEGIAVDSTGNIYVADTGNNVIKKVTAGGSVTVLAGQTGTAGYADGAGTSALFNEPIGVAVDSSGNVYVADFNNDVVRKVTSSGSVSTLAGQAGTPGYADGAAAQALFNAPTGTAVDGAGNVYITDSLIPATTSTAAGSNLLRKLSPAGVVSTLAGKVGTTGSADGTGTAAQFYSLQAVAVASGGGIYLADTYNQTIRTGGIAPGIAVQPQSQVASVGKSATFSVTPAGTGPFSYQWLFNGSAISGATGSSYTLASVASGNSGNYSVTVTNSFGSVTSSTATLIPVTAQPMAQNVNPGQSVTLTVSVADTSSSVSYQWLFNGAAIAGATSSSYTIANFSDSNSGNYSVIIMDSYGGATTNSVAVTTNASSVATDSPAMPGWMLAVLGGLLFLTAALPETMKRAGCFPAREVLSRRPS